MGDSGHHWVGLCPKPRRWSWFGGRPSVEARRVSPTMHMNMYTLKYIMEIGEVEGVERGKWRVWREGSGGCGERGSGGCGERGSGGYGERGSGGCGERGSGGCGERVEGVERGEVEGV